MTRQKAGLGNASIQSLPTETKKQERDRIAADVEKYLGQGGRIEQIAQGVSGEPTHRYGTKSIQINNKPRTHESDWNERQKRAGQSTRSSRLMVERAFSG